LISKGQILHKQRCFQRFRQRFQEHKKERELNHLTRNFALQLGFKTFKAKFVQYLNRTEEMRLLQTRADAFRAIILLKKSLNAWLIYLDSERDKNNYCQVKKIFLAFFLTSTAIFPSYFDAKVTFLSQKVSNVSWTT